MISCASKLMTKRKCWLRHAYCAFETRWNGLVLVFINSNKWFRASNCFNWISSGIVTDQISPIRLFVERGITVFYKFLKFSQFSLVASLLTSLHSRRLWEVMVWVGPKRQRYRHIDSPISQKYLKIEKN